MPLLRSLAVGQMAFDGKHSKGTVAELEHSQKVGKALLVIHDEEEDGGPYL